MNAKALAAALLFASIGAGLLWLYKERLEDEVSGGDRVPVLMATGDIPLGTQLEPEHLAVRTLPEAYLEERHVRSEDAERIIGLRVTTGLKANESILWSDLATSGAKARGLAALVQPGMRAVTVPATLQAAFGGLLRPGDRVDVLLTTERPQSEKRVSFSLLQNLLVLALGDDLGVAADDQPGRRRERLRSVTLGVTAEQAQLLAFAVDRGSVTLALRNPQDIVRIDGLPEIEADDVLEPADGENEHRRRIKIEMPELERMIERLD